jgi:DNA-binding HxlR family transcriptional regulator
MKIVMHLDCRKVSDCSVPKLYRLIGRRWVFPVFCRIREDRCYRYEDLISISRKNIHRTTLSLLLKEFVDVGLLEHKGRCYRLTRKGSDIQLNMKRIAVMLLHPKRCPDMAYR